MASDAPIGGSGDPLCGLYGPMLFPRTIRASADVPVPTDAKDLESIHNFMKSLELRSPDKLMNEAKKIVDGGAELLESNITRFTENVHINHGIAAKARDRPQERRQGLGRDRKRAPFSLRTNISQSSVSLEPTLDIENLQDPDEFFNAYERMENAKKEIEKQLGGNMDNIKHYKPSNSAHHRRREGILGKSYNYKHRYSSEPSENDMLISSQFSEDDTSMLSPEMVDEDVSIAPKDKSQEKSVHPDPIPETDLEEVELAASMKKTENEVCGNLEEFLSCDNKDLEGDGALNLLQEWLKIKPLDRDNLCTTEQHGVRRTSTFTVTEGDVGNTSVSTVTECSQKQHKSLPVIGNLLKILNQKSVDQEANPLNSSPTPPRSPFASLSSLQKRILQTYPVRDPFSPTNVDLPECQNISPAQAKNKLLGEIELAKDLGLSNELEPCMEVDDREPVASDKDAQEETENVDNLSEQFVDENANIKSRSADTRPNEESENINKAMNIDESNSNLSILENEVRGGTSSRKETDTEQQPEVHKSKPPRGRKEACGKRTRTAHPMRKSLAEAGTSFEDGVRRSKRIKMRPLEYWKGERFLYGRIDDSFKLLGVKYISPGKDAGKLKVKPYIPENSSEYKEILELAARH